jgi:drug/metabolite transporter (DMT)-like permease
VSRQGVSGLGLALIVSSVAFGAGGQVLLRLGARGAGQAGADATLLEALSSPAVLLGLAFYTVSSVLWLFVLSRVSLSIAYPMGALTYVFVIVGGLLMGEAVTVERWAGALLIVTGVVLVGRGSASVAERLSP